MTDLRDATQILTAFGTAILGQRKDVVITVLATFAASCCDKFGIDRETFCAMVRQCPK